MAAGVLGAPALAEASKVSGSIAAGDTSAPSGGINPRVARSFALRLAAATRDAAVPVPPHTTNGDEERYPDKSATYTKGLLQDDIGVVNPAAYQSFKKALRSGKNSDWEAIIIGGTRTQNGPQGSYAFDMEGLDSVQFGNAPAPGDQGAPACVPPFAQIASADYGAQLMEMYWSSLLYDVAFTDYATSDTAIAAAAELSAQPSYRGPRDANGKVTPDLLFRGAFPGETVGPYVSQFMITPTMFGTQPMDMLMQTFVAGLDYMTDTTTFQDVQNGIDTGLKPQFDPVRRYLHDGRGLAAYTHVDVLYQAYFSAFLVMAGLKFPLNPGNPYIGSKTQNGFDTFGGPDFAACQGEIAARALHRVWYQKWLVHLVHRPESGGGVLHQILSGNQNKIDARLNSNVLNSQAPQQVFSKYGTYLLPQPFPEGSPTHPSYPTGHGTVAGACITFLKFFFDQNYVIPNPMVPTNDGLSLVPYTGSDAGQITVGGELNKLAHNVSFGHGIHAGIHWRQDSDISIQLGEAMAISVLQDKAKGYNEKFTVSFNRLDGSTCTISNE
ncbi:MAG: vanadium-dependent haloperoxidase [Acidobacteriia bacterium]|nr:vanadium-dependent haloperoxidase [Terriglobia bacterium]